VVASWRAIGSFWPWSWIIARRWKTPSLLFVTLSLRVGSKQQAVGSQKKARDEGRSDFRSYVGPTYPLPPTFLVANISSQSTFDLRRSICQAALRISQKSTKLPVLVSFEAQSFPRKRESTRRRWRYGFVLVRLAWNCSVLTSPTSRWIPAFAGMTGGSSGSPFQMTPAPRCRIA
jgi:hypothetical protein